MTTLTLVALPTRSGEPDLLIGNEREPLILVELPQVRQTQIERKTNATHATQHSTLGDNSGDARRGGNGPGMSWMVD
ncbi:hypothetical protein AB4Y38_35490 [Paraburkholderia sp. EG285A]|uniref:hypothetical protein n=1 Tax=Paraburkholderia sp. EG285A TaxID=3237009 RepID=UPI0034D26464